MDSFDFNGGNAEIPREHSNLENDAVPEMSEKHCLDEENKVDDQEQNGDLKLSPSKKNSSPTFRKKLRKLKSNLSNVDENQKSSPNQSTMKLNKRKLSDDGEASSGEFEEFNGFDAKHPDIFETGSVILKKLIAEAETASKSSSLKRRKVMPVWKNLKNADYLIEETDGNTTDSEDHKIMTESDTCNITADESSLKSEKSANSSISVNSNKSRKSRSSRGTSPGGAVRQKVTIDISNPAYREPFNYGWKRELVYRGVGSENQGRRMADIYYYTPKGKKVRSYREVIEFLTTSELTIDNFTFFKEPLGVNDPDKEIIRDAKKAKDSFGNRLNVKANKKVAETQFVKKMSPKKGITTVTPPKTSPKNMKSTTGFKVKLPAKKGALKKEIKSPPAAVENEIPSNSQWNSPPTRRNQSLVEKTSPVKMKKGIKAKVQEPCSIRCSTSIGLIPTLQCSVCLCLYHPECTGNVEVERSNEFICKNCETESSDSVPNLSNPTVTPPPLIPISMLNTPSSNLNHDTGLPPKLQRIPKTDSSISPQPTLKNPTNQSNFHDGRERFPNSQSQTEYLNKHELSSLKPAQNIALMGGKKYIVIPKNNTRAVQPAMTLKQDKIGDKPPMIQDEFDTSTVTANVPGSASTSNSMDLDHQKNAKDSDVTVETEQIVENKMEGCGSSMTDVHKYFSPTNISSSESNLIAEEDSRSSVVLSPAKKRKKVAQAEIDQRQYFMVSVCAGYHALSRIFQYLKVQELLRAARVCRMWRDLAAHPSLWKTVRMKNSQVTDWDGFADTLKNRGTQHLDLRKMLIVGESDNIWKKFVSVIPRVTSLIKLELCRCPAMVVEEVMKNCPQLQVLSALSIKCDSLNLEFVSNLENCSELRLKAISGMALQGDLSPLLQLSKIKHLSLTSVKDLGKKRIKILQSLEHLETLDLGECSDFPDKFGTTVLVKLQNLEKLRLEKGQGSCCTFDILEGISKLENLTQLELVNFDVKNGFDKCLANCKNIKRLLIIPTYVSQSATSNNMILGGVTELSNNLTHFVWGVTQELLRVTELFVDQCNQTNKPIIGDSIPVLKPVPCLSLIEDIVGDKESSKDDKQQANLSNPQIEILPLPHLQKLLLTALPRTRVKILKIPFHATWRQSISDSTSQ